MKSTLAECSRELIILPLLICASAKNGLCEGLLLSYCVFTWLPSIIHLDLVYSPEEKVKQMEKKVNELIEESCFANDRGEYPLVRETHPDIVYSVTDLRKTWGCSHLHLWQWYCIQWSVRFCSLCQPAVVCKQYGIEATDPCFHVTIIYCLDLSVKQRVQAFRMPFHIDFQDLWYY